MPFAFDIARSREPKYKDHTTRAQYITVRDGTRLAVELLVTDWKPDEKYPKARLGWRCSDQAHHARL